MENLGDWDQLISVARNRTAYFCSTDVYQTIQYKYESSVRAKFWGIGALPCCGAISVSPADQ